VVITPALRQGAGSTPDGREWIARLPALVAAAVARWDLRLGAPFTSGRSSWCAPAALGEHAGGADLVLKISFPHEEAATEAAVLRAWAGHGAVGLVDAHAADWALLLRRVRPGTPLRAARTPVDRRLAEAAAVVRRLRPRTGCRRCTTSPPRGRTWSRSAPTEPRGRATGSTRRWSATPWAPSGPPPSRTRSCCTATSTPATSCAGLTRRTPGSRSTPRR
jgi:hypothetical protein